MGDGELGGRQRTLLKVQNFGWINVSMVIGSMSNDNWARTRHGVVFTLSRDYMYAVLALHTLLETRYDIVWLIRWVN